MYSSALRTLQCAGAGLIPARTSIPRRPQRLNGGHEARPATARGTDRPVHLLAVAVLFLLPTLVRAGNPLIPTVYSADPSGHVWPGDDRMWIYASNDQPGTNTHDTMASYHVFSSSDLVHWTDYGRVLHLKDVPWAASHMWAIDAVLWRGTYYLVFCAQEKGTGIFRAGLAVSPRPEGPFKNIGFIQGVDWGQDPSLFVDDDGQPYLFWGSGGNCYGAKLADDLRSAVPGTTVRLTGQLTQVYEGPWVHRYRGRYYLSYPGLPGGKWPEHMYYATADHPLGPYRFQGEYIGAFKGQAGTNHGSILKYKGRWYGLYHSAWLSGGLGQVRNLMMDELHYNADGTIQPITPTTLGVAADGVAPAPSHCTLLLEAENGEAAGGALLETTVANERPGYSGSGYVRGFAHPDDAVTVLAQSAQAGPYRLRIRYVAPADDQRNKLLVNDTAIDDPHAADPTEYDKFIRFPRTDQWTELDVGVIPLRAGDNLIKLYCGTGGIEVDCLKLEPAE